MRDDKEQAEEELRKWTGIGTGYMVSVLVGCGKGPDGRRMTRPRRERLREKEKTIADRESIFLEKVRIVFDRADDKNRCTPLKD